jgi:hypothetical protein
MRKATTMTAREAIRKALRLAKSIGRRVNLFYVTDESRNCCGFSVLPGDMPRPANAVFANSYYPDDDWPSWAHDES